MKVIFLDIDGVLNTGCYIESAFKALKIANIDPHKSLALRDDHGHQFDPISVRILKTIIERTGAKLVISSTWRGRGLEKMQELWKDRNLPGEVIDITPSHRSTGRNHLPFKERAERGGEIKEWLDNHPEVTSYLIIDDDDDMLEEQEKNFLQTDAVYGITRNDLERAIGILNGIYHSQFRNPKNGRSFEDYEIEVSRKAWHINSLNEEFENLRLKREEIQADIRNKLSPMKTLAALVIGEKYKDSEKIEKIMKETAITSQECIEYLANVLLTKNQKTKEKDE